MVPPRDGCRQKNTLLPTVQHFFLVSALLHNNPSCPINVSSKEEEERKQEKSFSLHSGGIFIDNGENIQHPG